MDAIRTQDTRPVLEITTQNAQMHITNTKPRVRIRSERPVMRVDRQQATLKVSRQELRKQMNDTLGADVPPAFLAKAERRAMDVLENLPAAMQGQQKQALSQQGTAAGAATPAAVPAVATNGTATAAAAAPAAPGRAAAATPAPNTTAPAPVVEQPQVQWGAGQLSIEWSDFVLEIDWEDMGGPQIEVEPHSVEVRVVEQPVVRFDVDPRSIPKGVGKQVDQSV